MNNIELWSHKGPHRQKKKKATRAERAKESRRDRENQLHTGIAAVNLGITAPGWETRNGTPNSVRVVRSGYTRDRPEKPYYKKSDFRKKLAYGILGAGAIAATAIASRKLTKPGAAFGPKRPKITVVPDVPKAPPAAVPRPAPAAEVPKAAPAPKPKPKAKVEKSKVKVDTGRSGTGALGGAPRRPGVGAPSEPMRIRRKSGVRKHKTVNASAFRAGLVQFARDDSGKFRDDPSLYGQVNRAGRQAGYIRKEVRTGANLAGDLHDVATGKPRDRRKKYEWEKVRNQDRVIKAAIGAAILGGTAYVARHRGQ